MPVDPSHAAGGPTRSAAHDDLSNWCSIDGVERLVPLDPACRASRLVSRPNSECSCSYDAVCDVTRPVPVQVRLAVATAFFPLHSGLVRVTLLAQSGSRGNGCGFCVDTYDY